MNLRGLVILLIVGFMIAYILHREIEEVLPPFVMTLLLGIYGLGILKKSHHAFFLSMCVFGVIAVTFTVVLIRRYRMKKSLAAQSDTKRFGARAGSRFVETIRSHVGFIVFLLVCVLMIWCYHTHFVMVWDDFHYNATFPKNCYAYGTMPVGLQSATHYKSYLPLLQLFFYWGFQADGFSEPLMFQYKMALVYVLILPLFRRINTLGLLSKIALGICAAILPFLFMYEVQESLSMDTVMALLFAYALVEILFTKERDHYCFYRILTALLCLTLIKTIAVIFTGICLVTWMVVYVVRSRGEDHPATYAEEQDRTSVDKKKPWNEWIVIIAVGVMNIAAYFSWKIFCTRNGNTNYLSNNLLSNLRNGKAIPDYAGDTALRFLKSLFTFPLNLGPMGLSIGGILAAGLIVLSILRVNRQLQKTDVAAAIMLVLGLAGYLSVLIYTYIFVFYPWEAESLSSLDRYLGTYATTLCYVILYRISMQGQNLPEKTEEEKKCGKLYFSKPVTGILPMLTIVLLATLPYGNLKNVLVPGRYLQAREQMYADRQEVHAEMEPFMSGEYRMGTMLSVNCEGNTIYDRGIDYEVLPNISRPLNIVEIAPDQRQEALDQRISELDPDYIYFSAHERAVEDISVYRLPDNYEPLNGVLGMFHKKDRAF